VSLKRKKKARAKQSFLKYFSHVFEKKKKLAQDFSPLSDRNSAMKWRHHVATFWIFTKIN